VSRGVPYTPDGTLALKRYEYRTTRSDVESREFTDSILGGFSSAKISFMNRVQKRIHMEEELFNKLTRM